MGNSIGSGPAIRTAARGARQLVVISGLADLLSIVQDKFKVIPTFLLLDYYENEKSIRGITIPVLIVHGTTDELIPISHAKRLAKASNGKLIEVPTGHEAAYYPDVQERILNAINETGKIRA